MATSGLSNLSKEEIILYNAGVKAKRVTVEEQTRANLESAINATIQSMTADPDINDVLQDLRFRQGDSVTRLFMAKCFIHLQMVLGSDKVPGQKAQETVRKAASGAAKSMSGILPTSDQDDSSEVCSGKPINPSQTLPVSHKVASDRTSSGTSSRSLVLDRDHKQIIEAALLHIHEDLQHSLPRTTIKNASDCNFLKPDMTVVHDYMMSEVDTYIDYVPVATGNNGLTNAEKQKALRNFAAGKKASRS